MQVPIHQQAVIMAKTSFILSLTAHSSSSLFSLKHHFPSPLPYSLNVNKHIYNSLTNIYSGASITRLLFFSSSLLLTGVFAFNRSNFIERRNSYSSSLAMSFVRSFFLVCVVRLVTNRRIGREEKKKNGSYSL